MCLHDFKTICNQCTPRVLALNHCSFVHLFKDDITGTMGSEVIHLAVVSPFPLSPLLFSHRKYPKTKGGGNLRPPMLAIVEGEELRSMPKEQIRSRDKASKNKKEQLHQRKVFFFMPS